MSELHNFGLIRFSKKTGKIDTTMTGLGSGMIKMWALQNTSKTKATVIIDIDERYTVAEYVGTDNGFPEIRNHPNDFEFNLPDELWDVFDEEVAKREARNKSTDLDSRIKDATQKSENVRESSDGEPPRERE